MTAAEEGRPSGADSATRFLDIADAIVLSGGPSAVTVRAVAGQAGVSETDLRALYPDRDHLLYAVLVRQLESLDADREAGREGPAEQWYVKSAADLITSLHWLYIDWWAERPVLARLWHEGDGGPLVEAEIERRISALAQSIHDTLEGLELISADVPVSEIRTIVVLANHARGRGLPQGRRNDELLVADAAGLSDYVSQRLPPRT